MNQFNNETKETFESMMENILVAMNENNYANFSKDFDEKMKNALNEAYYQAEIPAIKGEIGNYISKEFLSAQKRTAKEYQYTIVIYKAKFSQDTDDVYVKNVLTENNGKYYISGFWIHSLKLIFEGEEKMNEFKDETKEIADSMTENVLVAMNENNYSHFSEDFDEKMKNFLNETKYQDTLPAIKNTIGNYISKEFMCVREKDQYTIVFYKAKFSQEPNDVYVKNMLSENNGKYYISGFGLESLKLFLENL